MGHYYSIPSARQVEASFVQEENVLEEMSTESEDRTSTECIKATETTNSIYVLVHNGELKYYIQDETLLESKIQYYMQEIFQDYISRWDAFNFNVVTQHGICSPESGLVKRIRLMSRSRYLLGLHEQIEEELEIYRVPSFPGHLDDQLEETETDKSDNESDNEEENKYDSE